MEHYAGLDVSLKEISICVVDEDGATVARGACPADSEGIAGWFRNRELKPNLVDRKLVSAFRIRTTARNCAGIGD